MACRDVRDPLCRVEDREEVRLVAHPLERVDAIDQIVQRVRPARHHRRGDLVIVKQIGGTLEELPNALIEERKQQLPGRFFVALAVGVQRELDEIRDSD